MRSFHTHPLFYSVPYRGDKINVGASSNCNRSQDSVYRHLVFFRGAKRWPNRTRKPPGARLRPLRFTLADVDELLGELSVMTARQKSIESDLAGKLEALVNASKDKMTVDVDGQRIGFADRTKSIETALETWCAAHRRELLEEGAKSRKLPHGEIGWEKAKDTIDPTKSKEKKGNPDALDSVKSFLRQSMAAFTDFSSALCDCLTLDAAWSKTDLHKGLDGGKFTADEMRSVGFKKSTGQDEFFVRPAEVSLESLPTD